MTDRQLDMYRLGSEFLSMPKYVPGRLCGDDFLYFKWCNELAPHVDHYTVVIETVDISGATNRGISNLREVVEIPPVHLSWPSRIGVVPDRDGLPMFEGELVRGSLYIIPETMGVNGRYVMDREGMLRPN